MSDLDAPTGIIHSVIAGLLLIVIAWLALWIIQSIVMAETHSVYEPPQREWLAP